MNEVIYNEPFQTYLERTAVSKSLLDVFSKCPADAYAMQNGAAGKKQSKAMLTGKLVEEMVQSVSVFAPQMLDSVIAVHPEKYTNAENEVKDWNWNANYCKDWKKEVPEGKTVMSKKERDNILRLGDMIRGNKLVQELVSNGRPQVTLTATHATKLAIKGRPDWWQSEYIVDLKTTFDASPDALSRTIADRRYHVQAAMYMLLSELNGHKPHTFFFIVAQTGDTPKLNVRYLKSTAIDAGRLILETELDQYNQCVKSGYWPDYIGNATDLHSIQEIDIPSWAYGNIELEGAIEV